MKLEDFKPGDKVRVVKSGYQTIRKGEVGEVTAVGPDAAYVKSGEYLLPFPLTSLEPAPDLFSLAKEAAFDYSESNTNNEGGEMDPKDFKKGDIIRATHRESGLKVEGTVLGSSLSGTGVVLKGYFQPILPGTFKGIELVERPRPWENAKPGEVWTITYQGETLTTMLDWDGDFVLQDEHLEQYDPNITEGRRMKVVEEDA